MGTNYYAKGNKEELHIGKSSVGWCFSLHVIPEREINDLIDWLNLLEEKKPNGRRVYTIHDEYGEKISIGDLVGVISGRYRDKSAKETFEKSGYTSSLYSSFEDFLEKNQAVPCPNNLLRHRVGNHCVKHGSGTWDCITGEFS